MENKEFDYDEQIHCSSMSVYGMLKSWILQEPMDRELEQYQGINVFRKVINPATVSKNFKETLY